MSARRDARSRRVAARAREWLVRRSVGVLDQKEAARLEEWLTGDPLHRVEFERAERLWGDVAKLEGASGIRSMMALERRPPIGRITGVSAGALMIAVLALWIVDAARDGAAQEFQTRVAQVRELRLSDGTVVSLGASSSLVTEFDEGERRVKVAGGDAFFAVAPEASRPFIVEVDGTTIQVLGTRFEVHAREDRLRISVESGLVKVDAPYEAQDRLLGAGERVSVARNGRMTPTESVASTAIASWRNGFMSYDDAPLAEVIADANRFYEGGIRLAAEELGELRVSTSFNIGQVEMMVESLPAALPIRVDYDPQGAIVLSRRD